MSADSRPIDTAARLATLRQSFDVTFARPASSTVDATVDLLAIRVGGDAYALRLSEIAGLHVGLHVVALPNPAPHLVGIAAIRGVMAPIYDLAGLLGYPPAASCRWIAMARASSPVGLALECFEAHLRVRDAFVSINAQDKGARADRHARDAVQANGTLRPILQVGALIQSVEENSHDR